MDPGDQLYTLDELRCWKVENVGKKLYRAYVICL